MYVDTYQLYCSVYVGKCILVINNVVITIVIM